MDGKTGRHKISLRKAQKELKNMQRSKPEDWSKALISSVANEDESRFITDCLDLFRQGVSQSNPLQVAVVQNLVGKLKSGHNHHYSDIIKRVATLYKNWLGETNYAVLSVTF